MFQRLLTLLSISLFLCFGQEQDQEVTPNPELIEGPWETTTASGIDGIFVGINTGSSGPPGHQLYAWQAIDIRVYHREVGEETWGYFATNQKATPQSYNLQDGHSFTLFDGKRLRIHYTEVGGLRSFDLDVNFSPFSQEWSGTWSRATQSSQVVLKRPEPNAGLAPSPLVGDWARDEDHELLTGAWTRPDGGALNASDRFRRLH